jgi:co-chaperonin GroES (HSP10)
MSKFAITCIHNNVVLRPVDQGEQKSEGGIVLPASEDVKKKEYVGMAKVLAVGPGTSHGSGQFMKTTVKPGDLVIYNKGGVSTFRYDGEWLLMTNEGEIFGVVDEAAQTFKPIPKVEKAKV